MTLRGRGIAERIAEIIKTEMTSKKMVQEKKYTAIGFKMKDE